MGSDYRVSAMYLPVQRGSLPVVSPKRTIESGAISAWFAGQRVLSVHSECKLRTYMCGKSGVQQGISNAAAFPGDSALAIRTSGDKENETMAPRLPLLQPTKIVMPEAPYVPSGTGRKDPRKYGAAIRSGGDALNRSKTFPGIARAIAEQYSEYLLNI